MTTGLTPPTLAGQLGGTKGRVHALERRLARGIPPQPGFTAKFSLHGGLYLSTSGIEKHPTGGRLILVYAVLVVAGTTPTVIDVLKNGTPMAAPSTLTLPAGVRQNELVVSSAFSARGDELQVEITTAGSDAESLTVYGVFDR